MRTLPQACGRSPSCPAWRTPIRHVIGAVPAVVAAKIIYVPHGILVRDTSGGEPAAGCNANGGIGGVVVYTGFVTSVACGDPTELKLYRERSFACLCPDAVYGSCTTDHVDDRGPPRAAGGLPSEAESWV